VAELLLVVEAAVGLLPEFVDVLLQPPVKAHARPIRKTGSQRHMRMSFRVKP
jgi:hypothetical protein